MVITEDFVKYTSETTASEKEEHISCTYEERDAALIRLFKNAHSKEQIKETLGRKYRSNIKDLGILCHTLKYMYFKPETVMPLSTTGSLSETFGNSMKVSRVIDMACKIGLLEEVNGKYSYTSATTTSIHFKPNAKEYVCNRVVREEIEDILKENNIEIKIERESNIKDYNNIYNNTVANTFAKTDYKITSKTLIEDTDENILAGLYNHYSYVKDFQLLADEINEKENADPMATIKFRFNIHRGDSGKVTKIGLRATNSAVSFKEHEDENPNYKGTWRKDYLASVFGKDNYEEYDVHSSISNVNYLLNNGEWLGIDCYEKEFAMPWTDTTTRKWYKSIFMKLYFNTSDEAAAKSIIKDKDYRYSEQAQSCIKTLKQNVTNFIGKQYGSEIFLHESCIYLLVRKELMNRGIKCVQIYDGFYFEKGTMPEDMESIVRDCAMEYYNKYYKGEAEMDKDFYTSAAFLRFVEESKKTMEDQEREAAERAAKKGYKPKKIDKRCLWNNVEDIPGEWCENCIYSKCEYCPNKNN